MYNESATEYQQETAKAEDAYTQGTQASPLTAEETTQAGRWANALQARWRPVRPHKLLPPRGREVS